MKRYCPPARARFRHESGVEHSLAVRVRKHITILAEGEVESLVNSHSSVSDADVNEDAVMQKQSAEAEPNVVHEILHHIREFSYLRLKDLLGMFKETVGEWVNDKAPRLGASLAFYTLLSLAPLLVVIVAVAALVYGQEAARGQLVWQIQGLVGPDGARVIQGLV